MRSCTISALDIGGVSHSSPTDEDSSAGFAAAPPSLSQRDNATLRCCVRSPAIDLLVIMAPVFDREFQPKSVHYGSALSQHKLQLHDELGSDLARAGYRALISHTDQHAPAQTIFYADERVDDCRLVDATFAQ